MIVCISAISLLLCQGQADYWAVDYLTPPQGEVLEVGGLDFMSDGAMVVSTRRGQVWRIDNPDATDPSDAVFTLICEGLHEGLGLAVVDDEIHVLQRSELSKLVDLDGDYIIDKIVTITQDWGMSGNYHEFAFGLPVDNDGNMYVSLNVGFWDPHWWHGKSRAPYRGWLLKVSPEGDVTPVAGGFRSPAGMGLLEDGTVLVTDNQGDWMPVGPIYAVREDDFYGHPASMRWSHDQPDTELSDTQPPDIERAHPAIFIPYLWSRSAGNVIQDQTGGAFGPFEGQYFVAELTNGQVVRVDFEEIDGMLQGACWQFRTGVGSTYRAKFGPNSMLYAGMTNRGWGGLAPASGVARIRHTGVMPLEMTHAHLLQDGFEITFTKPLANVPDVFAQKYDYNWWWEYGSPQQNIEELHVRNVSLSEDRMMATISLDGLEAGKCVLVKLNNAVSEDGTLLLHTEMAYTLNKMPDGSIAYIAKQVEPPIERGHRVEGWLYLTWGDAFDRWNNEGIIAVNAELDIDNPTKLKTSDGPGALVANSGAGMSTSFTFPEGEITMKFMLAKDGQGVLRLPIGADILFSDDAEKLPGSVLNMNGEIIHRTNMQSYLGAGIWHDMKVGFQSDPPMVKYVDINGVNVALDVKIEATDVHEGPIRIEGLAGDFAFGDVRLRRMTPHQDTHDWIDATADDSTWTTEGDVRWHITDSGEIEVAGHGVLIIPTTTTEYSAIRFDGKIDGGGQGAIELGDGAFWIDLATIGNRKTGGITGNPVNTNLIDRGEWCALEVNQLETTTLLLNRIQLISDRTTPSFRGNTIRIVVSDDATVHIRSVQLH
jgi:glucose/arabinose dehydrogenase